MENEKSSYLEILYLGQSTAGSLQFLVIIFFYLIPVVWDLRVE